MILTNNCGPAGEEAPNAGVTALEDHPLAAIPEMGRDEDAQFNADIEAHGQCESITIHKGTIFDGRLAVLVTRSQENMAVLVTPTAPKHTPMRLYKTDNDSALPITASPPQAHVAEPEGA